MEAPRLPSSSHLPPPFFFADVVVPPALFRFSTLLLNPRPSSSFTTHRPESASNPSTTPRCRFSFLVLRPCSSTRVPMGRGEAEEEEEEEEEEVGGDAAAAAPCCWRCIRSTPSIEPVACSKPCACALRNHRSASGRS